MTLTLEHTDHITLMFLRARCHPTAPLAVRKEGRTLILSCYVPECSREVARFQLALEQPDIEERPELYDAARDACHAVGISWTDPRTGITHPPPEKP